MAKSMMKKRISMSCDQEQQPNPFQGIKDEPDSAEGCPAAKIARYAERPYFYSSNSPPAIQTLVEEPAKDVDVNSNDGLKNKQSDDDSSQQMPDHEPPTGTFHKSSLAKRMMEKMGYKEGKGLGIDNQGIAAAIETSKQKGRRGLGFTLADIKVDEEFKWTPEKEEPFVSIKEDVNWLISNEPPLTESDLEDKYVQGPEKMVIEDETNFCDETIVRNICQCKSAFDQLSGPELRRAVSLSNPFETIEKGIFQNRAAMKMANIDTAFDMMFTEPKNQDGSPMVRENSQDLLYFADICAGPGGFTEYVLWRKKWTAKGFGFTLRDDHDFKLEDFYAASTETFEPHYGENPYDGDGNIYYPRNLLAFKDYVLQHTSKCVGHVPGSPCTAGCTKGVHFVMADGGFSVEGQENLQEILSKRLYLCQFLTALGILRVGGHFVCKLFDTFTPFSVGLIYIMYRSFDQVCIFKPNTSRPANSERYLVCKWKKSGTDDAGLFLFKLNCILDKNELEKIAQKKVEAAERKPVPDILHVVPLECIKSDKVFFDYIYESNMNIGKRQIVFLSKVKAFAEDEALIELKQSELKNASFRLWKVPLKTRTQPPKVSPFEKYNNLMTSSKNVIRKSYNSAPKSLTRSNYKSLEFHHSYKCMVLSVEDPFKDQSAATIPTRGLIIGMGRFNNYIWDGQGPSVNFRKLGVKINIPPDSLFYAETVYELTGEGKGQRKSTAIHVIDSLFLGGIDVRTLPFEDRIKMTRKLVKAVQKPLTLDLVALRVKPVHELMSVERVFNQRIQVRQMKSGVDKVRLCFDMDESRFIEAIGLLIIPVVDTDKYFKIWSKSQEKFYYFNKRDKKSLPYGTTPPDAIASFDTSFDQRLFWKWFTNGDNVKADEPFGSKLAATSDDVLDRVTLRTFLDKFR